jgi:hypothetical protein
VGNKYRISARKTFGKTLFGRQVKKWKDNIMINKVNGL